MPYNAYSTTTTLTSWLRTTRAYLHIIHRCLQETSPLYPGNKVRYKGKLCTLHHATLYPFKLHPWRWDLYCEYKEGKNVAPVRHWYYSVPETDITKLCTPGNLWRSFWSNYRFQMRFMFDTYKHQGWSKTP